MIKLILLLILFLLTGIAFIFIGIKRRRMGWVYASLLSFLLAVGCGGWAVYKFATASYRKITGGLRSRTGDQVYDAVFGKRAFNCVKVTKVQDAEIPVMDDAIFLSFETCPQEMRRILTLKKHTARKVKTGSFDMLLPYGREDWFDINQVGDSVWVYEWHTQDGTAWQKIWADADSTRAFCRQLLYY